MATYACTSRRTSSGAGPSSADPRPRKDNKLSDFAKRAVDALLGATKVIEDLKESVDIHEERVAYRKVLKSYGIQASSSQESDDSDTAYESGWTARHSPAPHQLRRQRKSVLTLNLTTLPWAPRAQDLRETR